MQQSAMETDKYIMAHLCIKYVTWKSLKSILL